MANIPELLDLVHKVVGITCGVSAIYKKVAKHCTKKGKTKRNAKRDVPK